MCIYFNIVFLNQYSSAEIFFAKFAVKKKDFPYTYTKFVIFL